MNSIPSHLISLNQVTWCKPGLKPAREVVDTPVRDELIQQERWQSAVGRHIAFKGTSGISQALAMSKLQRQRTSRF